MNYRIKTSIYYLSQLLIIVAAIATGSPARADESLLVAPQTVAVVAPRTTDRDGLPSSAWTGGL